MIPIRITQQRVGGVTFFRIWIVGRSFVLSGCLTKRHHVLAA